MCLHDTPENWSIQVHFFAYAQNTQPLPQLHNSQFEIVFHTQAHLPLILQLNLPRKSFRECPAQFCSQLTPHSQNQSTDLYLQFRSIMSKPVSTWFLAI